MLVFCGSSDSECCCCCWLTSLCSIELLTINNDVETIINNDVIRANFYCEDIGYHDDVIKWKHFPRFWPFVRGIQKSPLKSPHKGQWRGASMFSLICARINGWANNRETGNLRSYRAHYDVTVMIHIDGKLNSNGLVNFLCTNASKQVGN